MPEYSLQFGGYLIVRLYDIVLLGRKSLAGDPLQQKKAEKSGKATVCLAKAKEGRGSPWNSPWVKSNGEN